MKNRISLRINSKICSLNMMILTDDFNDMLFILFSGSK